MLSDQFVAELRAVVQAQNYILGRLENTVSDIESKLTDVADQAAQIQELELLMAEIEASVDLLDEDDVEDFDSDEIFQLYENRRAAVSHDLAQIGFKDWDSFVRQCQNYALEQGLDPLAPYEALLTEADLKKLQDE